MTLAYSVGSPGIGQAYLRASWGGRHRHRGALGSAFTAPFGPGLSVAGAEVETGVATVPYFSMNAPRSLGLVYSTRQSAPRVLVPVDVEPRLPPGTSLMWSSCGSSTA
ncbi:MAG: hypothetical protein IPL76_00105 [Gemmatimonadetes bacterium]|nr:hypothetical protein [Gemmatimonadota bacterium]